MKHVTAGIVAMAVCGSLLGAKSDPLAVTSGLQTMVDSYLTDIARGFWQRRATAIAKIQTPEQVREHQDWARREFVELVGGFPARTELHPKITGTLKRDGYHIDKLIFESQPHFYVTAYVYVPDTVNRVRRPTYTRPDLSRWSAAVSLYWPSIRRIKASARNTMIRSCAPHVLA